MSKHSDKYNALPLDQRDPHPSLGCGVTAEQALERALVMAAAPELLEALVEARKVLSATLRYAAPDFFETDADVAGHVTISRIDSAITKARGSP